MVERRNMTLLGMTRSILKHMDCPNYLWGEAVRHATYLINRVATRVLISKTPYEALKNKKPNVDHLRIFGCVSYAKVDTPHLKKLDDRSRALVHLGTEPGMKPYRLYDPITRRVIVNRDVIFDENKKWNWSNAETAKAIPGGFSITFGDFGNKGVDRDDHITEQGEDDEVDNTEEQYQTVPDHDEGE